MMSPRVSEETSPGRPTASEPAGVRFRRWISRGDTWGELAGVLAVVLGGVVVALVVFRGPPGGGARGPAASIAPGMAQRLMAFGPREGIPASFDLAGAVPGEDFMLPEGAQVDLTFRADAPARAVVLEERARYHLVQLYPPGGRRSEVLEAGQRVRVTAPDGGSLVIVDPPGQRRVRLIVFPPEVDPLALQPTELSRVASRLTVKEHRYEAVWRAGEGPEH